MNKLPANTEKSVARSAGENPASRANCFHCGLVCEEQSLRLGDKAFCCTGCQTVFELLSASGLENFYELNQASGLRGAKPSAQEQFQYLDEPAVREALVDFADARTTRVTLRIPAIHCIACVWLLENLHRLNPGIGHSQVNFSRREVAIAFETARVKLSEVVRLLVSLGYEPELKLADLETRPSATIPRRLWLQLGVAGFAFGNTMLFSIAAYLGLDSFSGPAFRELTGGISLALALPVVLFSAADYWKSAWLSLRRRALTIDVPIAAGIAALFGQSVYEVASGHGEGYFDSLAGLLFFLLCGKLFQQKTFARLTFDRDFKSFFPLSVTRLSGDGEERVALAQLNVRDHLQIRHGELIPADARLVNGAASIDYSFVTGESEAVEKRVGDYLYAGGRQTGGSIEVEIVKPVSQSYLTSLWSQEAFRKEKRSFLDNLTNRYSVRFTWIILAIATGAAAFWSMAQPALAVKSFISVLIVACPCALALAAPFALGTAQRLLARRGIFIKNTHITEVLARVNTVVFDKTGTLTRAGEQAISFLGQTLTVEEATWVRSLTRQSTHPYAARITKYLAKAHAPQPVHAFTEVAGQGILGWVTDNKIVLGSAAWLNAQGVTVSEPAALNGSHVHLAINGEYRGLYALGNELRPEVEQLIQQLSINHSLALLSGDNEKEQARFQQLFGDKLPLNFHQSPMDKLNFIRARQQQKQTVMMVGDGLNDAGALKQSDVGVAVVEDISAFSPASDVILSAERVTELGELLVFAKRVVRVVRVSFLISTLYNVIGISIAASGQLSPLVCAILMPLSSVTVVAFACGATTWMSHRTFKATTVNHDAEAAIQIREEATI